MLIVGLTGGIASGKSTVSKMFQEAGIPVICFDELAREVVKPGAPALEEIRRVFGDQFVNESGGLNRELMARVVFNDGEKRRVLESITHPRIANEKATRTRQLQQQGCRMIVEDVPLLYEIAYERWCDYVIVVYVARAIQERRLMERDNMTQKEARSRLDAQMSIEDKKLRADYVIDNTGGLEETRNQVRAVLSDLETKSRLKEEGRLTTRRLPGGWS